MGFISSLFMGCRADRNKKPDIAELIKNGALVIDVRSAAEFASGSIEGAIHIPHSRIAVEIGNYETDKARIIIVFCASGGRSALAKTALTKAGYTQVVNGGGYTFGYGRKPEYYRSTTTMERQLFAASPEPPEIESRPKLPSSESFPEFPFRLSSPKPPRRVSSPSLPTSVSPSRPPRIESLPSPPVIESLPAPPSAVSSPIAPNYWTA